MEALATVVVYCYYGIRFIADRLPVLPCRPAVIDSVRGLIKAVGSSDEGGAMSKPSKLVSLALGAAVCMPPAGAVAAEGGVKLFKVVSTKDETVIGIRQDELSRIGSGTDVEVLARHLAAAGQMTVWQYATRKADDGSLQQAPLRQIAIFPANTVRIEPYATPLQVVAPK